MLGISSMSIRNFLDIYLWPSRFDVDFVITEIMAINND